MSYVVQENYCKIRCQANKKIYLYAQSSGFEKHDRCRLILTQIIIIFNYICFYEAENYGNFNHVYLPLSAFLSKNMILLQK